MRGKAFTIIELLIVIAVIGILSTLVTLALNGSRIKARNANAKNDVEQAGKSIELFRDSSEDRVISLLEKGGNPVDNLDILDNDETNNESINQTLDDIFTGVANTNNSTYSYGLRLTRTASADHIYTYNAPVITNTRELVDITDTCYLFYSNIISQDTTYFIVRNGQTSEENSEPSC